MDQPAKVATPAGGKLNRENEGENKYRYILLLIPSLYRSAVMYVCIVITYMCNRRGWINRPRLPLLLVVS